MNKKSIIKKRPSFLHYPAVAWMGILIGCPLIYIFVISFLSRGSTGEIIFRFTIENYSRILSPTYLGIFADSLLIAMMTSLITLLIGYPFAYFTVRLSKRIRYTILLLVMIPFWTSSLLRLYGWITLLQNNGIFNSILLSLGLIKEPAGFMYNYVSVLTGTVYMLLPFMILPLFNSIDKLDRSLLEASYDLGASRINTFFNVTLPLTMPGIVGGISLVFIPAVGLFFISDLLGGAKTMLLGNLIQNQVKMARNKPFGAALSIVMMMFVVLFLLIYRKASIKTNNNEKNGGIF